MSILIVDDSLLNMKFFQDILQEAGYSNIHTASSAQDAYIKLGMDADGKEIGRPITSFDLVLLDVVMPEMDGIEACRRIKSCSRYRDLPIIFVTANKNHLQDAFDAGGMDFIQKGFERVELLARVKSAITLKKEMDSRKDREAKMTKELQLAKTIQRSVLSPPIVDQHIEIHGAYIQSDEVSGDMFYWTPIDEHRYGIMLIDVSGHGLSSSLISMSIRSLLGGLVNRGTEPEQIFYELNRQMLQLFGGGKKFVYLTAIYLVIDIQRKHIKYFNAGHPPGLLIQQGEVAARLESACVPIGVKRTPNVKTAYIPYETGNRLVIYTDGLVETKGTAISAGIHQLELDAVRFHSLNNQEFIDRVVSLRDNKADDVCLISILLK
ncbi:fused response regulator/phosphatase [Paenibacillus turpanensis]|uniref:fused response regulator/phosphatase n=1 Tax=Paenibacillus turpanensis TaxID=2689078 RepID=UPI001A9F4CFD|nr:fused response regulator/phosphatase [Paenibacillus turpanensis]